MFTSAIRSDKQFVIKDQKSHLPGSIRKQLGHKLSPVQLVGEHKTTYEGTSNKSGHNHNTDGQPLTRLPIHKLGHNGQAIAGIDLTDGPFGPLHYGTDLTSNSENIEVYGQ